MNGLRRCKGKYHIYEDGKWHSHEFELGYFHQWGVNYQEFEEGPGNYTVAIVELPDGQIIMPVANDIVFLDKSDQSDDDIENERSWLCPYIDYECHHSHVADNCYCKAKEDRPLICPHERSF